MTAPVSPRRRAHKMHQPGARPPRGGVEARLIGLRSGFAVAGERGIDQPHVERRQIVVGDPQPAAHRRRIIGNEDIGIPDEPTEHGLPRRQAEIES